VSGFYSRQGQDMSSVLCSTKTRSGVYKSPIHWFQGVISSWMKWPEDKNAWIYTSISLHIFEAWYLIKHREVELMIHNYIPVIRLLVSMGKNHFAPSFCRHSRGYNQSRAHPLHNVVSPSLSCCHVEEVWTKCQGIMSSHFLLYVQNPSQFHILAEAMGTLTKTSGGFSPINVLKTSDMSCHILHSRSSK
jgi:hypothetical protein